MFNFSKKREVKKPNPNPREFADVSESENTIIRHCEPFTMTGKVRLLSLIRAMEYLDDNSIAGDIIECGVWKGGSIMAAAMKNNESQNLRDFYLYDTFEGMTQPDERDVSFDDQPAIEKYEANSEWCMANIEEVRANISTVNYPEDRFHFRPGMVEDTIPHSDHGKIAMLRLDTDWYESTKVELEYLFPKLVKGGILIIDDYGHWKGARKATDEYLEKNNIQIFLNRIDYTCRLGVKQ